MNSKFRKRSRLMSQNMLSSSEGVSAGCRTLSAQPFPICQLVTVPVKSQHSTVPTCQPGTVPTCKPGTVPTCQPGTVPNCQPGTVPTCQNHTVPTCQPRTVPTCQNHVVPTSCQLGTVPSIKTWECRHQNSLSTLPHREASFIQHFQLQPTLCSLLRLHTSDV